MTTHIERLHACLNGILLDRPPVVLWRHFPVDDQTPEGLAASTINFQRTYDFDLVKVTPASSFCLKDWGSNDEWQGDPEGTRRYTSRVIQSPQDWERLHVLDPSAPYLAGHLACLRILKHELGPEIPILQTIFSPLAQAKNLVGGENMLVHLHNYPDSIMIGLEKIAKSIQIFIEAVIETGVDGIFYAVQHAQAGLLTVDEFLKYGRTFDLDILKTVQSLWLNMLHVHGKDIYYDQVCDYPVQIINWHDHETAPSLAGAMTQFSGVVCGGLSRDTIVFKTPHDIYYEVKDAITQTQKRRFILGTGCVVPIIAPHGNLIAVRESVEKL